MGLIIRKSMKGQYYRVQFFKINFCKYYRKDAALCKSSVFPNSFQSNTQYDNYSTVEYCSRFAKSTFVCIEKFYTSKYTEKSDQKLSIGACNNNSEEFLWD
jgi:hypothetical protein